MYSDVHTNWSTGDDDYTTESYTCIDGGNNTFVNFCGSYHYNGDGNQSSMDYSTIPGIGIRTLGGNDTADPDPEHVIIEGALYATSMTSFGGVGGNLMMHTSDWNDPDPGTPGDALYGIEMVFFIDSVAEVPVPAAFWMFASALGSLGFLKRKRS